MKGKVYGLYFADASLEGWLNEMGNQFKESDKPCILYFWWHQNPVGREKTLNALKEVLKRYKDFPILAFADNKLKAAIRIEGFLNVQEEDIPEEWSNCEGYKYWKNREYKQENWNKKPKILFKVSKIKKIDKPFRTHIDTQGSRGNMRPLSDEDIFKLGSILKDIVPELVEALNAQKFRRNS